jgi:hypothetical protein
MSDEAKPKDLSIAQRSVLLTLMIKNAPVSNQFFRNNGTNLDETKRGDLEKRGWITIARGPLVYTLTEKGWSEVKKEIQAETPPRAGAMGGTLYMLLNFLHGYFERNDLSAPEFFGSGAAPRAVQTDLETRIRKTYAEMAPRSGDYVMLDDLRRALSGATKTSVDQALRELDRAPDIHLAPESNQKVLTASQRAAAIRIGRQDMHLIAIGS